MNPKKYSLPIIFLTTLMLTACGMLSSDETTPVPQQESPPENTGPEPTTWTLNVKIPVNVVESLVIEVSEVIYEGSFDVWPDGSIDGSGVGHFEGTFRCVNIEEDDDPTYGPGDLGGAFVFEITGRLLFASEVDLVREEGDIQLAPLKTAEIELAPLNVDEPLLVDEDSGAYYARIGTPLLENFPQVTVSFGREKCGITGQNIIAQYVSWGWIPYLEGGLSEDKPEEFIVVPLSPGYTTTLPSVAPYVEDATVSIDLEKTDP